jgi:hypothetical protein
MRKKGKQYNRSFFFIFFTVILFVSNGFAQLVTVGNGGYTKTFPGTDSAGRNGFPSGTPNLSGVARHWGNRFQLTIGGPNWLKKHKPVTSSLILTPLKQPIMD